MIETVGAFLASAVLALFFGIRLYWTYRYGKRPAVRLTRGERFQRFVYEWATCGIFPGVLIFNFWGLRTKAALFESELAGIAIFFGFWFSVAGIALMLWVRTIRGRDWGAMGDDPGPVFFTQGPYEYFSHPYYVGALFVGVGVYLLLNSCLIVTLVPGWMFIRDMANAEDQALAAGFGAEYARYHHFDV